jgi:hypothetical protein
MQYLLDYLAAAILGTALLLIMVRTNDTAAETQSLYHGDALVQEMLVQTSYLLQGELRNMGVGVPETARSVMNADTSMITFLYDIDRDGVPDTVQYFSGTTNEMIDTPNELDRPLYRRVNSGPPLMVGAVTVFRLRYLTRVGEVLPTPVDLTRLSEIYSVEITMEVQNPYAMMRTEGTVASGERIALYSSSIWQQTRLASQNTRR